MNEVIQDRLMRFLRDESLQAGDSLPSQARLAASLGVSQAALREAMRSLEALGILEARVGSGWYVKEFSFGAIAKGLAYRLEMNEEDFFDLIELRASLECSLLDRAVQALTRDDVDELLQIATRMELAAQAGQVEQSFELDHAFHRKLFSRIRNRLFGQLMDIVWALYPRTPSASTTRDLHRWIADAKDHQLIAQAVQAGDMAQASRRLQRDFEEGIANLRSAAGRRD